MILIPIDSVSQDDLRVRLPGRNLIAFVKWFESGKSREIGPWREFHEELIRTEILPSAEFPHLTADFVRRRYSRVHYSDFSDSQELLIADIFDLILSDRQREVFRTLTKDEGKPRYIWADATLIRRRGAIPGKAHDRKISITAQWTLE
jgi:hypothetical protein